MLVQLKARLPAKSYTPKGQSLNASYMQQTLRTKANVHKHVPKTHKAEHQKGVIGKLIEARLVWAPHINYHQPYSVQMRMETPAVHCYGHLYSGTHCFTALKADSFC